MSHFEIDPLEIEGDTGSVQIGILGDHEGRSLSVFGIEPARVLGIIGG